MVVISRVVQTSQWCTTARLMTEGGGGGGGYHREVKGPANCETISVQAVVFEQLRWPRTLITVCGLQSTLWFATETYVAYRGRIGLYICLGFDIP